MPKTALTDIKGEKELWSRLKLMWWKQRRSCFLVGRFHQIFTGLIGTALCVLLSIMVKTRARFSLITFTWTSKNCPVQLETLEKSCEKENETLSEALEKLPMAQRRLSHSARRSKVRWQERAAY
jgi:hypothetical protein